MSILNWKSGIKYNGGDIVHMNGKEYVIGESISLAHEKITILKAIEMTFMILALNGQRNTEITELQCQVDSSKFFELEPLTIKTAMQSSIDWELLKNIKLPYSNITIIRQIGHGTFAFNVNLENGLFIIRVMLKEGVANSNWLIHPIKTGFNSKHALNTKGLKNLDSHTLLTSITPINLSYDEIKCNPEIVKYALQSAIDLSIIEGRHSANVHEVENLLPPMVHDSEHTIELPNRAEPKGLYEINERHRPREHTRRGYWKTVRTKKGPKKVFIEETIINKGVNGGSIKSVYKVKK